MYQIAIIIVCGAAFGLLILQTAQNCSISFTAAEKAAIKAAAENFMERLKNGIPHRRRDNRGA